MNDIVGSTVCVTVRRRFNALITNILQNSTRPNRETTPIADSTNKDVCESPEVYHEYYENNSVSLSTEAQDFRKRLLLESNTPSSPGTLITRNSPLPFPSLPFPF